MNGGFLELTLDSGEAVVLDVGADWTLTAHLGLWVDDFAEPLSEENREFVRTHGKWTSEESSPVLAATLLGARIESVHPDHDRDFRFGMWARQQDLLQRLGPRWVNRWRQRLIADVPRAEALLPPV